MVGMNGCRARGTDDGRDTGNSSLQYLNKEKLVEEEWIGGDKLYMLAVVGISIFSRLYVNTGLTSCSRL